MYEIALLHLSIVALNIQLMVEKLGAEVKCQLLQQHPILKICGTLFQ